VIAHVGVDGEDRDDQCGPDADQSPCARLHSAHPSARWICGERVSAGPIEESPILALENAFAGSPGHSMQFGVEVDVTGFNDTELLLFTTART
jgi:hypothetical protein